ncbi:hypothetical protein [Paractinoplanes rishiriensis]|uniref:Uncharacterized protein n=1 Tax=Paractinoplanes rishiriensis TaxID=1050105 RepID=A0A919K642_9ACTN|nr:hypothetical protein [Actinoplanes rishiriensis]GIF00038.1 hypothetical protein Ari01nite_75020 [Actinoplanes rishiriensis]
MTDNFEDARLLDELRRALGPDRPPAGMAGRAEELLAFAGFDRELAELLADDATAPTGVRGPATVAEPLVFRSRDGALTIELTVTGDRIDGQVIGDGATEVVLEQRSGPQPAAPVDELGRFGFDTPGAGPARLRVLGGWTRPVTTDWFLL